MAELKIGLEGVAVAETKITFIDGIKGQLAYRGHRVEELVKKCSFEDIVFLLWNAHLPNAHEAQEFKQRLAAHRLIPDYLKDILKKIPLETDYMSVLRTAVSALTVPGESWPPTQEQAIQILAKVPTIISYRYHCLNKSAEVLPKKELSHVENYLYMLSGKIPDKAQARALETYLMLSADHDINASTFTARVVTSTQADIISAITAAIGALKGPLHGGAPSEVDDMLDEIKTEANIEPWVRKQLAEGERIMGFGHRVYKTYDPRAMALKEVVQEFSKDNPLFKLSLLVEEKVIQLLQEYKPGRNLYPNVEFWAAGVLRTVELPRQLYTPTFCLSRVAGWSAQIIEQADNNRLIRPSSIYIGSPPV